MTTLPSHPRRAATFIGIGAINTLIDVSVFACLYQLVGLGVIPANVLAFLVAVTNSYAMNLLITFSDRRSRRGLFRGFARFLLVAIIAMSASTAIVYILSFFMHPLIAKLVATGISTVLNYLGCYHFVFSGAGSRPGMSMPSE